jgi:hypothetical protein
MEPRTINNHSQPLKWKGNSLLHYSLSLLLDLWQCLVTLKNNGLKIWKSLESGSWKRSSTWTGMIQTSAHVALAPVAQKMQTIYDSRRVNKRIILGLFLCCVLAPLADNIYAMPIMGKWFDAWNKDYKVEGWYYDNFFFLFLCIGPYLDGLFTILGLYLIFIQHETRRAYLFVFPLGLKFAKIVWLLMVKSHPEFHHIPMLVYYSYGFTVAFFIIFISDYLAWRKYHRADAHEARMETITRAHEYKLIPPEQVAENFATTWREMKIKAY